MCFIATISFRAETGRGLLGGGFAGAPDRSRRDHVVSGTKAVRMGAASGCAGVAGRGGLRAGRTWAGPVAAPVYSLGWLELEDEAIPAPFHRVGPRARLGRRRESEQAPAVFIVLER